MPVGHIRLLSPMVFDVDIHRIPATRTEPEHEHLDIRFLVEIDESLPLPGNNESHDLRWVALRDVPRYNRGRSLHRLVVKSGAWRRLA